MPGAPGSFLFYLFCLEVVFHPTKQERQMARSVNLFLSKHDGPGGKEPDGSRKNRSGPENSGAEKAEKGCAGYAAAMSGVQTFLFFRGPQRSISRAI